MDNQNGNVVQPASPIQQSPRMQPQFTSNVSQHPEMANSNGGELPNKNNKVPFAIALVLLLFFVVGGVIAFQKYSQLNEDPMKAQQTVVLVPTIVQSNPTPEILPAKKECDDFPNMLESCSTYICEFTHPLTGEQMTREITGLSNSTCLYSEEMPNGGEMNCEYTDEMRIAVANYHKELANAKSIGTELSVGLGSEETGVTTTYTIDGKTVNNPLQEALNTGQCIVSGY